MLPTGEEVAHVLERATGARRGEAAALFEMLREVSGAVPVVWAGRIIGFGEHHYRYDSGHSGVMPELAFAPGARHHTLYLVEDFAEAWPELLAALGPHRSSKVCLYLTRLAAVDQSVLRTLLERSLARVRGSE